MLALYGYEVPVSGVFDARTEAVVRAFQRHFRPARVDGVADASTITTLRDLLRGFLGAPVTHFTWEVTVTPKTRAGDLLDSHLEKNGRLPRYNESDVLKTRQWQPSSKDLR